MILYLILKGLFRIATKVYFRSVQITDKHFIPTDGPLIVVANHPNTFLDPMLIGSILKPRIHFLVKGAMFSNEFLRWLFAQLGMIPIYRRNETADAQDKNVEVFNECYKMLKKGKELIIFPEGLAVTERKLRPIKKGPAWIALGAEEAYDFNLNIKILPIGLNYTNPHQFGSEVLVRYGEPIHVKDFIESFKTDNKKGVDELTEVIKSRFEELTIVIEDEETDKLVADIETIYRSDLKQEYHNQTLKGKTFAIAEDIFKAVSHFSKTNPTRVENIKVKIKSYIQELDKLGIRDTTLKHNLSKRPGFIKMLFTAILFIIGLPAFVYGMINNFLPFFIPKYVVNKYVEREAHHGSIMISLGILTFLIFYIVQSILIWSYSSNLIILLCYALSLPLSGLFAYSYWKRWKRFQSNLKLTSLLQKDLNTVSNLVKTRESIINELEQSKDEFLKLKLID